MYMIAFVKISLEDGISKKILSQAAAISRRVGYCVLLCLDKESRFQTVFYTNGEITDHEVGDKIEINFASFGRVDPFIKAVEKKVQESRDSFYIRHMVPSRTYLKFLKKYQSNGIIYEIPTYPYYYEQITASNNKALTLIRLTHESIYWPSIYKSVKKIVAIPCRSNAKKYKKMQYITNGYSSIGYFSLKGHISTTEKAPLVLIGVGTIQKYHGYEKIIELIQKKPDLNVRFLIVGGGEIHYLQNLVEKYELQDKVIFTGPKSGEELELLYNEADVGVGTMALELRKADIDTGIKILDYYVHGLPVISSGKCPDITGLGKKPYIIMNENTTIDNVLFLCNEFGPRERNEMSNRALELFSWESIMGGIINE